MLQPLTPTQAEVLGYIALHITQRQRPPTRREVAIKFGWASGNAAETHIKSLERLGYIALDAAARRGGHAQRYVRVIRWPENVQPLIAVATTTQG